MAYHFCVYLYVLSRTFSLCLRPSVSVCVGSNTLCLSRSASASFQCY
jgi:hypothetical protein